MVAEREREAAEKAKEAESLQIPPYDEEALKVRGCCRCCFASGNWAVGAAGTKGPCWPPSQHCGACPALSSLASAFSLPVTSHCGR